MTQVAWGGAVALLLLKLTITPTVIALATLAARRFGPAVGGWLIGLPFTCGPVALFLALEHGPSFTSRVATGFVAGVTAQAAFVLGYVAVACRGGRWPTALAAGTASFAVTGAVLDSLAPSLASSCRVRLRRPRRRTPNRRPGLAPRPTVRPLGAPRPDGSRDGPRARDHRVRGDARRRRQRHGHDLPPDLDPPRSHPSTAPPEPARRSPSTAACSPASSR